MAIVIERARPDDLSDVLGLLARHQLPTAGAVDHVATMLVARDAGRVVGAAAIEPYAGGALLRSVVVDRDCQRQRIGHRLTEAALELARRRGADTVFLLTTTAEQFFPRFGFEPITRSDVPLSVQQSLEFQFACPDTAVVMRKHLTSAIE